MATGRLQSRLAKLEEAELVARYERMTDAELLARGTELLYEVEAKWGPLGLAEDGVPEKDPPSDLDLWRRLKARLIAEGKYAPAQGGEA